MKKSVVFSILLLFISVSRIFSQEDNSPGKPGYLSFQSGLILDSYASVGIRFFVEYQKEIKAKWYYGISFEHSRHIADLPDIHHALPSNLNLLSFNGYYRLSLLQDQDKVFWNAGVGLGLVHIFYDDTDKLGYVFNASLTLNVKLSKCIYLESSPMFVLLPTSRAYYSPMNLQNYNDFYALSFLSIGLKIKL